MNDRPIILAVDDNAMSLEVLVKTLSRAGYQVRPADSGELALAAVAAGLPDLILLDVCMPGIDGLEVCRRLKAREETRHIPIILVSASSEANERIAGLQLGAADYISKPFHSQELLARVKVHLDLSKAAEVSGQQTKALVGINARLESEIAERTEMEGELRRAFEKSERSRRAMLSMLEDQKRAGDALKESEEKFSTAFHSSSYAIAISEISDGRIVEVNNGFMEMLGYTHDELIGHTTDSIGLWHDPSERAEVIGELQTRGRVLKQEYRFRKKSGGLITGLFSAHTIAIGGRNCVLSSINDITELRELEERMRQSQKMEAIGQLAGGIAHDFNNILGGIMGYAELLQLKLSEGSENAVFARKITDSANKAASLTRQLLTFARRAKIDIAPVDVHASIARIVDIMTSTIDKRIVIDSDLKADPSIVSADAAQLESALLNLGINARDAMPDGGKLTFSTSSIVFDGRSAPGAHITAALGRYLRIQVEDTGTGMVEETRKRVFEPFFTTKPVGQGTGLGLAAVYGFINQLEGYVTVESVLGRGSVFALHLPYARQELTLPEPPVSPGIIRGAGLVLVVDDEEMLRESASDLVRSFGYDAVAVADGLEAVEYFSANHQRISVVLLDLIMPRMGGASCLRELRRIHAGVKVIAASGYGANDDATTIVTQGAAAFIAKPYRAAELSQVLADVLNVGVHAP